MSDGYGCPYCTARSRTFAGARAHASNCPTYRRRLNDLGNDLSFAVETGKMKLEAAEAEQAKRPKLVLE